MTHTPTHPEAVDSAIAEKLHRFSGLAAEAHRLVAATRNAYGEVDPDGGHAGTLAAAQVYALLALAVEVHEVVARVERYVGGAR